MATGRNLAHAASTTCALPGTPLAQASAGLDACVHCGFCLQACPTYVTLEDENDSPRGRLVLMRRLLEGEIPVTDEATARHLDRCLGCRGCETACPSGVPYGALLEATRATMAPQRGRPLVARLILAVFRHQPLLRLALWGARLARATRLPHLLARLLPSRAAFPFAMLASTTPRRLPTRPAVSASNEHAAAAPPPVDRPPVRTVMLEGCVMAGLFAHVQTATATVLTRHGCRLEGAPGQGCCGALHAHAGDLEGARALARANIAAFETADPEVIVVNAAGCGAMLKEYGHLLHDDPAWAERAEALASRVRDVSEFVAARGVIPGARTVAGRVTHDAPCHQQHAQRLVAPPLQLLQAIPGLDLVPLEDSDQCCGSAGIYNLLEPEVSDAVLSPKLARIAESGATVVATGNPGCHMQIGAGLLLSGSRARVHHPVELLAASYTAPAGGG